MRPMPGKNRLPTASTAAIDGSDGLPRTPPLLTNARRRRQLVLGSTLVLKGGAIPDERGVQLAARICALNTMKAVRAHKRGGPEVLRYEDAPVPEVGASEVLVEVHAAAVTPGELVWDETWVSVDGAEDR